MTHTLDPRRRGLTLGLASATLLAAWPRGAHAQGAGLNVLAHNVHKTVATGKQGGDITEAWSARTNTAVNWLTFDTGPLRERLKEAAARDRFELFLTPPTLCTDNAAMVAAQGTHVHAARGADRLPLTVRVRGSWKRDEAG